MVSSLNVLVRIDASSQGHSQPKFTKVCVCGRELNTACSQGRPDISPRFDRVFSTRSHDNVLAQADSDHAYVVIDDTAAEVPAICVCVCLCVCMCVCVCVTVHSQLYTPIHTHSDADYMVVDTSSDYEVCLYVCLCVCVCACVCV